MWSLGFTAGAVIGSVAAGTGIGLRVHLGVVGAALLLTVVVVQRWLVPDDPAPTPAANGPATADAAPRDRRVSVLVVAMAAAALAAAMLEVMPNDWAAVYMRDVFDLAGASGVGTVAVAGAMLVGRLGGDHVLDRVGPRRLLNGSLTVIALGALLVVAAPVAAAAIVGLAIWGVGMSVVFPQLYATAARLPGASAGTGLGSMLLGQRFGGMLTAVVVGALAEWQGLRTAFAVVSATAVGILVVTVSRTVTDTGADTSTDTDDAPPAPAA